MGAAAERKGGMRQAKTLLLTAPLSPGAGASKAAKRSHGGGGRPRKSGGGYKTMLCLLGRPPRFMAVLWCFGLCWGFGRGPLSLGFGAGEGCCERKEGGHRRWPAGLGGPSARTTPWIAALLVSAPFLPWCPHLGAVPANFHGLRLEIGPPLVGPFWGSARACCGRTGALSPIRGGLRRACRFCDGRLRGGFTTAFHLPGCQHTPHSHDNPFFTIIHPSHRPACRGRLSFPIG